MGKHVYHHEHEDHLNADLNHLSRGDSSTEWHHVPALPSKGGGSGLAKKNRIMTGRMVKPGQHFAIGNSSRLKHAGHEVQGPLTPGGRPMRGKLAASLQESRSQVALARLKKKQAANNTLIRSQSHEFKKKIPDYLQSLIDVDGDGHVDQKSFR